jgi:hypothetical protein
MQESYTLTCWKGDPAPGHVAAVTIAAGSGLCGTVIGWPVAVLGGVVVFAIMWTVSSQDRTRRLATLIHAARGPANTRKK